MLWGVAAIPLRAADVTITVNADGTFTPQEVTIKHGDTVTWELNHRTDTIIPVGYEAWAPGGQGMKKHPFKGKGKLTAKPLLGKLGKLTHKPYESGGINEFTGPMPQLPSGIYTLSPNDAPYETDQAIWSSDQVTGVFIRLRWDEIHTGDGVFVWEALDAQLDQAVTHGKVYSVCVKAGKEGTPDWIFSTDDDGTYRAGGGGGVTRYTFKDGGSSMEGCGDLGDYMDLGNPTDPVYQKHYFNMLRALSEHLRLRNDWYRALAYVKPSGANLSSHENRLPRRCLADPYPNPGPKEDCICNPEVWANAGYTPNGLYHFYQEQTRVIKGSFPSKAMSYMLIKDAFPQVNNDGDYLMDTGLSSGGVLPEPEEQTQVVLDQGQADHGVMFAVQYNGLGKHPDDGGKLPLGMVVQEGDEGQMTGFQTVNAQGVNTLADLDSALRNASENSDAVFVEIYQGLALEAVTLGPVALPVTSGPAASGILRNPDLPDVQRRPRVLDPDGTGRTLGEWADVFHEKRVAVWNHAYLLEAFPMTHRHTFKHPFVPGFQVDIPGQNAPPTLPVQVRYYYANGTKTKIGSGLPTAAYGVIVVEP